ncbi:MAG TPA: hypothetical protein VGM88_07120 [Kofleriaceae bacterium]|jgi:hypothetical protein
MSTALVPTRGYLTGQRREIIARSVAASLVGAVPLPFLDDWAIGAILGAGYRHVAAAHQIDLDPDAVKALVFGDTSAPSIVEMAGSAIAVRLVGRTARRMAIAMVLVNRARQAARTFLTMTLFDHYCAKLHRGGALDAPTARALRLEIGRAIDATPGALALHPFRKGLVAAARASLRTPLRLADFASRGAIRRLLSRKSDVDDAEAVDDLEAALERALAEKSNVFARAVASVEANLSAEGNPFLDSAIESMDMRWRARLAVEPK